MYYEKFTDRARLVVQLANQAAQRLNHEWIGTEHILFGLIKEDSGVAAVILKSLGISLRRVQMEVEKTVPPGPANVVIMGKLPQTPRVKKVIEYAMDEARQLNHDYIGTEHILLGLLRETGGVATTILMNLGAEIGFTLEKIRENVLELFGRCQTKPQEKSRLQIKCTSFVILGEEVPLSDILVATGNQQIMEFLEKVGEIIELSIISTAQGTCVNVFHRDRK